MADDVLIRYKLEIEAAQAQLNKLKGRFKEVEDAAGKSGRGAGQSLGLIDLAGGKLSSTLKTLGKQFLAAFAVQRVIAFSKELVRVAQDASSIKSAFDKLNDPQLLNKLRTATRGMVADLDLMKQAVRAQNFKVPLDILAKGFEFAEKRADQTGESVNALVDSFIDGFGSRSPKALLGLGIGVTQFRNELKKTGDFTKAISSIITSEINKMGDSALDSADKLQQQQVKLENLKIEIGEKLIPVFVSLNTVAFGFISALGSMGGELVSVGKDFNTFFDAVGRNAGLLDDSKGAIEGERARLKRIEDEIDAAAKKAADSFDQMMGIKRDGAKGLFDEAPPPPTAAVELTEEEIKALKDRQDAIEKANNELQALINLTTAELIADELTRQKELLRVASEGEIERVNNSIANEEKKVEAIKLIGGKLILDQGNVEAALLKLQTEKIDAGNKALTEAFKTEKAIRDAAAAQRATDIKSQFDEAESLFDEFIRSEDEKTIAQLERQRQRAEELMVLNGDKAEEYKVLIAAINDEIEKTIDKTEERIATFSEAAEVFGTLFSEIAKTAEMRGQAQIAAAEAAGASEQELSRMREELAKKAAGQAAEQAKIQAAFGIFQIGISQGIALAKALEAAFSSTPPGPQAFFEIFIKIAALTAAVMAQINSAKQAINSASFAEGQVDIQGKGTGTSDSIRANISKGESVTTAAMTAKYKPLLKAIHADTVDSFLAKNYVIPAMEKASDVKRDHITAQLFKQVNRDVLKSLSNKNVNIENADLLGTVIASKIGNSVYSQNRYK